jgi:hypothetical protein
MRDPSALNTYGDHIIFTRTIRKLIAVSKGEHLEQQQSETVNQKLSMDEIRDLMTQGLAIDGVTLTPKIIGHNLMLIQMDERSTPQEQRTAFELLRPSLKFKIVEEYMGPQAAAELQAVRKYLRNLLDTKALSLEAWPCQAN